jgi:hypothetical protein
MATVTRIPREPERDETMPVPEAAERALEAAKQLVEDWAKLARLEATAAARRVASGGALLAGGVLLLLLAWIAAAVGAAIALARVLPPDVSVGCVALAHVALGAALVAYGRRRLSGEGADG